MGENASPTHSPPIGVTPSTSQTTTLSQSQPPYPGLIRPQPQLPQQNAAISAMVAACVANGQMTNGSPTVAQTLLHHHLNQQQSPLRIRINSPTRINSTSSSSQASSDHVITTTSSPTIPGATLLPQKHSIHILNGSHLARMSQLSQLHRPFESPSPTPPATAAQTRHAQKDTAS
jgi:hypothetical protein